MDDFSKEAVIAAMTKMFRGSHFSICDVDKCLKITGGIPNSSDYDALSALHCVHWSDMSPQLRQQVLEKTVGMLSCAGFDLSVLDMVFNEDEKVFQLNAHKKKWFRLLK
jgi:hypothetical protein